MRAEAVVDLAAVAANIAALQPVAAPGTEMMAVVKADGYGHGMLEVARRAVESGVAALGVATLDEGVALSAADLGVPLVAWLWPPGAGSGAGVGRRSADRCFLARSPRCGTRRGIRRCGDPPEDRHRSGSQRGDHGRAGALLRAAAAAQSAGLVRVEGLMSHLASADVPGDPSVAIQTEAFVAACSTAAEFGIRPRWRHLANTAGTMEHPATHFDLVRCGIGIYGITPVADPGGLLRPAMTLRATVALAKRVPAGQGVSYGLTYRTSAETNLALVPLGYADGIPRNASSIGEVMLGGRRRRIAGRVAMDQFVLDCGDDRVAAGDEVLVFGPGDRGEPTAEDWASATGTIGYEIVTRIGARIPRRYLN